MPVKMVPEKMFIGEDGRRDVAPPWRVPSTPAIAAVPRRAGSRLCAALARPAAYVVDDESKAPGECLRGPPS
jgi:hypothetical protein